MVEARVVALHRRGWPVRQIAVQLRIGCRTAEGIIARHLERPESPPRSPVFRRSVAELVDQALSARWTPEGVERGRQWPQRPRHAAGRGPTGLPLDALLR